MAKVTSKLQVTVPKAIADRYGIEPGVEIEWEAADDVIRVIPPGRSRSKPSTQTQLRQFDAATRRQRAREQARPAPVKPPKHRGWRREELYRRGGTG